MRQQLSSKSGVVCGSAQGEFQVCLGVDPERHPAGTCAPPPPHAYGLTHTTVLHRPSSMRSAASPAGACLSAGSLGGRPRPWRSRSASSPPGSAVRRDTSPPAPLKRSHRVTHRSPGSPYLLFTDVSEARAKQRPKRRDEVLRAQKQMCFQSGIHRERFVEILLGGFKVFMSHFNKLFHSEK